MSWPGIRWLACLGVVLGAPAIRGDDRGTGAGDRVVFGEFSGSSPCGEAVARLFDIPPGTEPPLRWELTLYREAPSRAPAGYRLRVGHGEPASGGRSSVKEGRWSIARGTKSSPDAVVYELDGALPFVWVSGDLLHALNPDGSLMVGDGGWSYTLNRAGASEAVVPPEASAGRPSESYRIAPLSTGPATFGVFEGRTPCQGIARELGIDAGADRNKAKWRVTLYCDPATRAPTTYKIEGTLYRRGIREGTWSIIAGTADDPGAVVYHLSPARSEAGLSLLKGDDNVLFFLDHDRRPLVGHADFSYTLNRREATTPRDRP
jgi:hypothetical protein